MSSHESEDCLIHILSCNRASVRLDESKSNESSLNIITDPSLDSQSSYPSSSLLKSSLLCDSSSSLRVGCAGCSLIDSCCCNSRNSSNDSSMLLLLPPECLDIITSYIDGYDLLSLFLTFNSELVKRLIAGVSLFCLSLNDSNHSPSLSYPIFNLIQSLSSLSSIHISFISDDCIYSARSLPLSKQIIRRLPINLQSLSLDFEELLSDHHIPYLPKHLKCLILPWNRSITELGLSRMPVGLLKLSLPRICASSNFLLHLPPKLTSLNLNSFKSITTDSISHLPQTLTELYLNEARGDGPFLFPQQLVLLELESLSCPLKNIQPLPSQLTHLNIHSIDLGDEEEQAEASRFPARLTFLDIGATASLSPDLISKLPHNLERLNLEGYCGINTAEIVAALPRSLVFLNLEKCAHLKNSDILDLPQHLTYLNVSKASKLTDECIVNLPRSLTWLELGETSNWTNEAIRLLPTGLLHLEMNNASRLTDQMVPMLPRNLTYLSLQSSYQLTEEIVEALPKQLKHVHFFANSNIKSQQLKKALPKLVTLSINYTHKM